MNNPTFEVTTCEVCDNVELQDVLDLGMHPMCDDLVEVGDGRQCKEYQITITYCRTCNTAHQKYQIPKHELFSKDYHYRSRFTADVLKGMKTLVEDCAEIFGGFENKRVLDIGCNDGSLLNFFNEKNAITFGIEPTNAYKDAIEAGHKIYNDYLTLDSASKIVAAEGKFDFITFTNVFAHIEDLKSVLSALKILMHESTALIIENHYLGAVIAKNQFDTFYHEHPRTYSYQSFKYIAKSLGLEILKVSFPSRYGGNIRVVMGNKRSLENIAFDDTDLNKKESGFYDDLLLMASKIDAWKHDMGNQIKSLNAANGPMKGKAFPGRAAILVKLLSLDTENISAVYEKPGSMKIGHFLPGTRIPILSDDELFKSASDNETILNLAWHIKDEIEAYLKENGYNGNILNILT